MNIFRLDNDPLTCAQQHCDRHLVKMPLEYLELLSGLNHPLGKWVFEGKDNFNWLQSMASYVCQEFLLRYGQVHNCAVSLASLACPKFIPDGYTPQPFINEGVANLADSVVTNYRSIYLGPKHHLCSWSHRLPPEWFTTEPERYFLGPKALLEELLCQRDQQKLKELSFLKTSE